MGYAKRCSKCNDNKIQLYGFCAHCFKLEYGFSKDVYWKRRHAGETHEKALEAWGVTTAAISNHKPVGHPDEAAFVPLSPHVERKPWPETERERQFDMSGGQPRAEPLTPGKAQIVPLILQDLQDGDLELQAIASIVAALNPLDGVQRQRALSYAGARYLVKGD